MNRLRKCVANCVTSFRQNLKDFSSFFLPEYMKESFLGVPSTQYVLVPIKTKSPQKPTAAYRSFP